MIISHSRKFIFVKTMKTAGTSMEIALSRYCGSGDVLSPLIAEEEVLRREVAAIGAQNFERPPAECSRRERLRYLLRRRLPMKYGEHMPAWQIRRMVGEEVWGSYFKFAAVRDPFDRCVSRYFYTRKYFDDTGAPEIWDRGSFDQFLRYHPEQINENWKMYTEHDRVTLDFLVRYEHLEEDLAVVSRKIGLEGNLHEDMQSIRAKGDYRPRGADGAPRLDERQRQLIALMCAKEIELFGYGGDGARGAARA